ncbi:MAG: DUF2961 domain-containing protein [Phycisphaerae bacterium]|jgi:hypothetical protein
MTRGRSALPAFLLPVVAAGLAQAAETPWVVGIEELHRLDLLPAFKKSVKVGAVTSHDRTGGNDDGFSGKYSFVRKEGEHLVLADLKGPGCVYRIHTPTPTDDPLEFYFDGEETPRISLPFRELFTGAKAPFLKPLVGSGGGGYYCYVPLPYRRSCKIMLRGKHLQFYDLNYATYPEDAPVDTFDPRLLERDAEHLEKARALLDSPPGRDLTAYNLPPGCASRRYPFEVRLEPGGSATLLKTDRPGRVAGLRLGPADLLAGKQRDILLKITWDGDDQPAVLCPAGDFFGYAWGRPAMRGLLMGTVDNVNYCHLPMPFEKSARIELVSLRSGGLPLPLRGEVIVGDAPRRPDEGRFYAVWRRENPTTRGKPFTFIETKGRGHLVGLILQAQGVESGHTYFFEGDDQTTIDGELVIHGTGSEDFFNGGWYDVPDRWDGPLSRPLSGCLAYQKHLGRTGAYRFFLGDAYNFRESILQTIEHAPTNNDLLTDYCGLTLLYCQDRPTVEYAVPDEAARRVVDIDKITFAAWWSLPIKAFCFKEATLGKKGVKLGERNVRFLSLRANGPDDFGPPFISITCELPAAGRYDVFIEPVKGPELGRVQLFQDEAPVGEPVDLYAEQPTRGEPLRLGAIQAVEGPNHLMFKIVGKNEASKALGLDIINIICQKRD